MRSEQINGVPLSDVIGGGDPERVASEIVSVLSSYTDLASKHSILDVGCGCGRIATALTQCVGRDADYVGVDIVPGLLDFAKNFISPRYPRFKFLLLDEGNLTYDAWRPKGSIADLQKLSDARPEGSVDLAISVSLFTHLDEGAAREILNTIGRLLATDGLAFITFFVVDDEAREGMARGTTGFQFAYRTPSGELFAEKIEDPTYAVGYSLERLDKMVRSSGLRREDWIRGYWSQGNSGETFQDAVMLRKT